MCSQPYLCRYARKTIGDTRKPQNPSSGAAIVYFLLTSKPIEKFLLSMLLTRLPLTAQPLKFVSKRSRLRFSYGKLDLALPVVIPALRRRALRLPTVLPAPLRFRLSLFPSEDPIERTRRLRPNGRVSPAARYEM